MKFSQDWFSHNIPNFQHIKGRLGTVNSILEIGCFEGRATCWMLKNMLASDGSITCIDTFGGSEEHSSMGIKRSELVKTFTENVGQAMKDTQDVTVIPLPSYNGIAKCITNEEEFDFIYVDGSHTAPDVMQDACMAFGLLRSGGIMLFDDYLWTDMPGLLHRPKVAVDLFTTLFSEHANVILLGYQLAIQKN